MTENFDVLRGRLLGNRVETYKICLVLTQHFIKGVKIRSTSAIIIIVVTVVFFTTERLQPGLLYLCSKMDFISFHSRNWKSYEPTTASKLHSQTFSIFSERSWQSYIVKIFFKLRLFSCFVLSNKNSAQ